jgi:serine/threonine protein phosphatase PrpC
MRSNGSRPGCRQPAQETASVQWITASETHPGVRREHNEDAILARDAEGLWVVADGMGGHEAGDVASRMVVDALAALEVKERLADVVDQVDDALLDINLRLRAHAAEHFGGRTMGCTVVGMLVREGAGVALWAGDSRLYRLRDRELVQVTRDHSPLEELVEQGAMTEEEAEKHPDANVITRAVGGQSELCLDIVLFDVQPGDTYLLCSDGLYREVSYAEIGALLAGEDVAEVVRLLLDLALQRGARDNVSLIVVRAEA